MTDLDDRPDPMLSARLTRHLERSADDVSLRRSSFASIVRHADRRRRRQRVVGTVGAVAVVVGATVIALAAGRPGQTIVPSEPAGPSTTTDVAPTTVDATVSSNPADTTPTSTSSASPITPSAPLDAGGLRWSTVEPDVSTLSILSATADVVAEDTPGLTWTPPTDPARPSILYQATDGIAFAEVSPGPGLVVLGGTASGGRIDVIGHAPHATGTPLADSGLALASRSGNGPWTLRAIDLVLPQELAVDAVATAGQASIANLDGTIVATATIVSGTSSVTKVFLAPPVGEVLDVSDSLVDGGVLNALVTTADDRFLLTTFHGQGTAEDPSAIPPADVFTSPDGATWQQLASPPIVLGQVESFGGSLIAGGPGSGSDWVSITRDGEIWTPVDLGQLVGDQPDTWQLLPFGVAPGRDLVAIAALGPVDSAGALSFGIFVSPDLEAWELVEFDDLLGGGYAQLLSIGWVDGQLVVRVAVTVAGDPLASTTRVVVGTPSG